MVPENITIADPSEIRRDLEYMTARWHELPNPAVFEIRAFKEGSQPQSAKFAPDWIGEAVEWCERMNELGFNIYAVRNPIRHDVTGSAKDTDILAAFFLWADCDDPASAGNVKRFDGPKYSAAVTTGRTPSVRVHVYWQLEQPCMDMAVWREMQTRIAAHFNSDKAVVNPSRIMRVGGTVAYPAKHKQERGYTKELTTIRTEYDDAREAVTLDQMDRVFAAAPQSNTNNLGNGLNIDTGPQPLDRERTRIQALSGQDWHHSVVKLVASYVSRGLSDDEIHGLTDPLTLSGYTVEQTRREVQTAIDGARRKGWTPEPDFTPNFDHAPAPTPSQPKPDALTWRIQTAADFTADFVAPEYLIDGVIQRGRLYTLTAPTGAGKTAAMLYAATAIAMGEQFCGRETASGDVLFLAGENPDDVRARFIATMEFYGIDPAKCRVHFIAGTFSIRADMARLKEAASTLPDLLLVVVDTFAAYFDGDDENSNAQALDFARIVRSLTAINSKPAVVMPAHPVKNATRQNLTPKGGSSLLNEVDGNLTLWNNDGIVSMHWQGKHRGPDFEPMQLELQRVQCEKIRDHQGRIMPTILAKPVLELRAIQIARETLRIEDQLLLNIGDDESLSIRERCRALGVVREGGEPDTGRMSRLIDRLRIDKMIKKVRRKWALTEAGRREVESIVAGESQPVEPTE